MSEELVKTTIHKNFPELTVNTIEVAGEGMDSKAFLVNDELIFRFPKKADTGDQLNVEIKLLPKLQPRVRVAIPDFKYIGKQDNGLPFVGYQKIQGIPLDKELFDSFDQELQTTLIKQIANFLQQVHSYPADEAQKLGVRVADFRGNYRADIEAIKEEAWNLLDDQSKKYIERLFTSYFSDEENFNYTPTLLHSDLSSEHIFYDLKQKLIVGIIDFGDIEIGDPDYDLIYLYQDYSPESVEEILKFYPHDDKTSLMKKLDFFSRRNTIRDVLIGVRLKDDEILQQALAALKSGAFNFS